MKKDFLEELIEELEKLHEERKVSGLAPELARGKTIEAFLRVAKNHHLTLEEKQTIAQTAMAMDGITTEEAAILRKWEEEKNA